MCALYTDAVVQSPFVRNLRRLVARVNASTADSNAQLEAMTARLDAMETTVASLGRAVEGHTAWLTDLQRWVSSCVNVMVLFGADTPRGAEAALDAPPDVIGRLLTWTEIQTLMSWIRDAAHVPEGPLVSVTIATRNRPELVPRAIASVLNQSYRRLELVVVDDSDGEATQDVLKTITDPRLRTLRSPSPRGQSAAYNLGLDAARGDVIAFLDDDNVMHPEWLRSVVWAFEQRPGTEALYGARIVEDPWTTGVERFEGFPVFQFARYDRRGHERGSSIDRNVVAVRSSTREVRYDEELRYAVDWDYSLRLFARWPPLALPVVACYYGTSGSGRISGQPDMETMRRVRSRAHFGRPLKVHVHCAGADSEALQARVSELIEGGAKVTLSADEPLPAVDDAGPWRQDVKQALEDAKPDLALVDSPENAAVELLTANELPFAVSAAGGAEVPEAVRPFWLGPVDGGQLEPALRDALTRWLYERTADWA